MWLCNSYFKKIPGKLLFTGSVLVIQIVIQFFQFMDPIFPTDYHSHIPTRPDVATHPNRTWDCFFFIWKSGNPFSMVVYAFLKG